MQPISEKQVFHDMNALMFPLEMESSLESTFLNPHSNPKFSSLIPNDAAKDMQIETAYQDYRNNFLDRFLLVHDTENSGLAALIMLLTDLYDGPSTLLTNKVSEFIQMPSNANDWEYGFIPDFLSVVLQIPTELIGSEIDGTFSKHSVYDWEAEANGRTVLLHFTNAQGQKKFLLLDYIFNGEVVGRDATKGTAFMRNVSELGLPEGSSYKLLSFEKKQVGD